MQITRSPKVTRGQRLPVLLFTSCLWLASQVLTAQDISGKWQGQLSQEIWGSVTESPYQLEIEQQGRNVSGVATIEASEFLSIGAKMRFTGIYNGRVMRITEQELLEGSVMGEGVGWCMKTLFLQARRNREGDLWFEGDWEGYQEGNGEPCQPGKVTLRKVYPGIIITAVDSLSGEQLAATAIVTRGADTVAVEKAENSAWQWVPEAGSTYYLQLQFPGYYDRQLSLKGELAQTAREVRMSPIKAGDITVLDNVQFEQGKYKLTQSSMDQLKTVASFLKRNPGLLIEISGHTSDQGDEELNRQLSYRRALEVARYLHFKGVPQQRMVPKGYGSGKPVADNGTTEGRIQNRRVEFKVVKVR